MTGTGTAGCCARAASGHVTAEPPMTLMKSLRRTEPPAVRLRTTPVFKVYQIRAALSALGHKRTFAVQKGMSALPPCVDGSELARTFLNVCSIGRCSHVFGLFARFT